MEYAILAGGAAAAFYFLSKISAQSTQKHIDEKKYLDDWDFHHPSQRTKDKRIAEGKQHVTPMDPKDVEHMLEQQEKSDEIDREKAFAEAWYADPTAGVPRELLEKKTAILAQYPAGWNDPHGGWTDREHRPPEIVELDSELAEVTSEIQELRHEMYEELFSDAAVEARREAYSIKSGN